MAIHRGQLVVAAEHLEDVGDQLDLDRCLQIHGRKEAEIPLVFATEEVEQEANAPTVTIHRSPRLLRHVSLKKTVTAEDNEYEHIWQSSNNKGHRPPAPATANSDVIAEKSALSSPVSGSSLKSISKASRDVSCDSVLRKSTSASPTNQKAVDLPQTLPHYVTHKDIVSINATLSRSGKTKSPSSQDTLQKFSTFLQPSVQ